MESRLDIVLLGATGYTGKHTAKCLALICREPEYVDIKWGIAGRSNSKMQNLLTELEQIDVDTSKIPVMECDIVNNANNIVEVTKRAKVIMNATGPNTLLSEPIVKACIESKTHYVDLSAELYHMINIYRNYNEAAEQANTLVVPACGFACIPVIAGLIQMERIFEGTIKSVQCYTVLDIPVRANFPFPGHNNSVIHSGTWESLVPELRNRKKYSELEKQTFPETEPLPEELKKPFFHRHKGRLWYPYPGPETGVIKQSQYQTKNGKGSYHFQIYTTMPLFIHFLIVVPVFFIYYIMSYFACFNKLLCRFPGIFSAGLASHKGPNDKMREDTKFSFTLNGEGWSDGVSIKAVPDKKIMVTVSGTDPGYRTTAICFIFAAITVLRETSKMPSGGVVSAGAAFKDTDIIDHLVKHGIEINIAGNSPLRDVVTQVSL